MNIKLEKDYKRAREYLCQEAITSRFFNSNYNKIEEAIHEINVGLCGCHLDVPLGEFYTLVGLPRNVIGDFVCWQHSTPIVAEYKPIMVDKEPCLLVDIQPPPITRYYPNRWW